MRPEAICALYRGDVVEGDVELAGGVQPLIGHQLSVGRPGGVMHGDLGGARRDARLHVLDVELGGGEAALGLQIEGVT